MIHRRQLLGGSLAGLVLAACDRTDPRSGFLGAMQRWNDGVQGTLHSRRAARRPDAITPAGDFPAYHVAPRLPVAPAGWALKVGGLVARPRTLSLADLQRMPRTDLRVEHHCVEGWSAIADWHGVRISDLAEVVGVDPRAEYVDFRSFDTDEDGARYWSSWDRDSAWHSQTILAYGMNGKPLSVAFGAPVRLYGAVKLGYKNVKYLTEVNFLDRATGGYWEEQGYEWFAGT